MVGLRDGPRVTSPVYERYFATILRGLDLLARSAVMSGAEVSTARSEVMNEFDTLPTADGVPTDESSALTQLARTATEVRAMLAAGAY